MYFYTWYTVVYSSGDTLSQSLNGWVSLRASQQADLSSGGVTLNQKASVVQSVKCQRGVFVRGNRWSWVASLCVRAVPRGSVWTYSMCCVSSGFCMFERVGMRWKECGSTPDPQDYALASGAEEYRAFLPASPRPEPSHIPRDSFPTKSQTHNSILSWQKTRKSGCSHERIQRSAHAAGDPTCEATSQFTQQAHRQGTHTGLCHTHISPISVCVCVILDK